MGLAIVRHLVELHGGTVSAESDGDRKGAKSTIRLPAISAHEGNGLEVSLPKLNQID